MTQFQLQDKMLNLRSEARGDLFQVRRGPQAARTKDTQADAVGAMGSLLR